MQAELSSHKMILSFITGWIIVFLGVLLLFAEHEDQARIETGVVLVLTIVVAAALSYVGLSGIVLAGILGPQHRREFASYAMLGLLALILAAILSFTTNESMAAVAVTVAPFPVLFGVAELRMAQGLSKHHKQAHALAVSGLLEFICGLLLACSFVLNDRDILRIITFTAVVSVLQFVPFLTFHPHQLRHS